MSEADKMFEELDYIKQYQDETGALYEKESIKIEFGKRYVMLTKKTKYRAVILNGEELKAINKKCLELRMDRGVINNVGMVYSMFYCGIYTWNWQYVIRVR